jgi:hypothetical protein
MAVKQQMLYSHFFVRINLSLPGYTLQADPENSLPQDLPGIQLRG